MKRPTFFLSSTIFDFADLRGAIKHMLEQRGCLVLASEFNDFRKPLDIHSYDACLKAIEQADYFVLLVGSRVGGMYDAGQKISITRQEYRAAYRLHQAGKLKIIALVRSDIWALREDRKALERHLKSLELEEELARTIAKFPSKFAEDADQVISFVEEIGRNQETRSALKGLGPMPTGNWVHVFRDFSDIASLLSGVLLGGLAADEAAFRRTIRRELVELLRAALPKIQNQTFEPTSLIRAFARDFPLKIEHREAGVVSIPPDIWDPFSSLMMSLLAKTFPIAFLDAALASPTFLSFDPVDVVWRETPVFEAIFKLRDEIRAANANMNSEVFKVIYETSPRSRGGKNVTLVHMSFVGAAQLTGLAFRWANVVELACALIAHLDGKDYVPPDLMPFSPLKDFDQQIARSQASLADVEALLEQRRDAASA